VPQTRGFLDPKEPDGIPVLRDAIGHRFLFHCRCIGNRNFDFDVRLAAPDKGRD
jgi:hypothetical protein